MLFPNLHPLNLADLHQLHYYHVIVSIGKLRDATGSYDLPFYISGALVLAAATSLGMVVKWSCWRESRLPKRANRGSVDDQEQVSDYLQVARNESRVCDL